MVAFMESSLLLTHVGSIPLSDLLGFPHPLSKYLPSTSKPLLFQALEKYEQTRTCHCCSGVALLFGGRLCLGMELSERALS